MIRSFRHKGLKLLYYEGDRSKLRPDIAAKVERFFTLLDQADKPEDVDMPGFGLHALKGNKKGFWSVSVSRNHRLIFRLEHGEAYDLDLVDYH
jgi:proteic killer suppression protein